MAMFNDVRPLVMLSRFLQDETGTTAIEYALIAAGISIAIAAAAVAVGTSVSDFFVSVETAFQSVLP